MENKVEKLLEKSVKNQTEIIKLLKQVAKNQNKSIFDEIPSNRIGGTISFDEDSISCKAE